MYTMNIFSRKKCHIKYLSMGTFSQYNSVIVNRMFSSPSGQYFTEKSKISKSTIKNSNTLKEWKFLQYISTPMKL